MLAEAGIEREECYVTNTFNFRPQGNKIETLCCGATDKRRAGGLSALVQGKYLRAEFLPELERLKRELEEVRPNITVALGNTACWALLGQGGISKVRGTVALSGVVMGQKVLPTYHPAAVLREWSLRHVTILDLRKARKESEWPEVRIPKREIWIEPSLTDLGVFYDAYIRECMELAFDIETVGDQITCIGFAPAPDKALVVPFTDTRRPSGSYWRDRDSEIAAWRFVKKVLGHPCRKVAQNAQYDLSFLWQKYGIAVNNMAEDSMLLHHALLPESEKSLGFMASVYCVAPAWKSMRTRGPRTIKQDD